MELRGPHNLEPGMEQGHNGHPGTVAPELVVAPGFKFGPRQCPSTIGLAGSGHGVSSST